MLREVSILIKTYTIKQPNVSYCRFPTKVMGIMNELRHKEKEISLKLRIMYICSKLDRKKIFWLVPL